MELVISLVNTIYVAKSFNTTLSLFPSIKQITLFHLFVYKILFLLHYFVIDLSNQLVYNSLNIVNVRPFKVLLSLCNSRSLKYAFDIVSFQISNFDLNSMFSRNLICHHHRHNFELPTYLKWPTKSRSTNNPTLGGVIFPKLSSSSSSLKKQPMFRNTTSLGQSNLHRSSISSSLPLKTLSWGSSNQLLPFSSSHEITTLAGMDAADKDAT